ncbi:hypothetical protein Ndes2526A_g05373 [Nannochloris sp. 'desiccata']
MGKVDKKAAATSSRAAELLAKSGTGATASGFGGFSGNAPVSTGGFAFGAKYISKVALSSTEVIPQPSAGPSAVIPSELDGELSQQLQRLTKRDATTRLKALQTLRSLVSEKSEDDVKYMLSPWAYSFGRLVMDTNRAVRAEACLAMGAMATAAGRNMAPFIKFLYPYWLLAQHDVSNEVVSAATSSMQATFPGKKAADVLIFCRNEVLKLLSDIAPSTPQSLGDARKESFEELQSRHECVLAATCAVLGNVVKNSKRAIEEINSPQLNSSNDATTGSFSSLKQIEAHTEILEGAKVLLKNASFLKSMLQSKSLLVRRSAYNLIASICHTAPEMISSDEETLASFTPLVFGCLGEKESGNHSSMWDMVLSFASRCGNDGSNKKSSSSSSSSSWSDHVNLNKAVLPKLWSLLRHGCYGSAEGSYPAVLPFINLLVQSGSASFSSFGCDGFESLLSAVWDGVIQLPEGSAAQEAAATCFSECYLYGIVKAEQLTDGKGEEAGAKVFCKDLTAAVIEKKCLVDAIGGPHSSISCNIVVKITAKLAEHARNNTDSLNSTWKLELFIGCIGIATAEATRLALENINAPGAPSLTAIQKLLLGVETAVGSNEEADAIALSAASPVVAALLPYVHSGGDSEHASTAASTAASALLASLVKRMPNLNTVPAPQLNEEFSAMQIHHIPTESILKRIIEEKQTGAALQASCDLLTSCLLQQEGSVAATQLSNSLMGLQYNHSVEAATTLLSRFIGSAPEEKLAATRSPELMSMFSDLIESLHPRDAHLCIMLLLGNGTTTSLLDEKTQGEAFVSMSEAIETGLDFEGSVEGCQIECALRIITSTVFSPVINSSTSAGTPAVAARLRAVAAAYAVLVDEACEEAAATLEEDYQGSETSDEEEEVLHSHLYSLAFGLWSMPDKIGSLLQQSLAAFDGIPFVQTMAHSISSSLATYAADHEVGVSGSMTTRACFAAATCTKMALDAMSQNVELFSKIFLHLIAKALAPYAHFPVFFSSLGEVIGWQRLLIVLGDGTVEFEDRENSELISKILILNGLEPPAMLLTALLEKPKLLEHVLKKLFVKDTNAFSQLLCAALSSSNDEAITVATSIFREYGVAKILLYLSSEQQEGNTRHTSVPVLTTLAPVLRSSEKLLAASALPELAQSLCRQAITSPEDVKEDEEFKAAAAACFPAPSVAPPVPRWAPPTESATSFVIGNLVWYRHRYGNWEASEIVSIDISVEPPSFAVKLAAGVRETESGRLVARNSNDPPPFSSSGGAGEGYGHTFDGVSLHTTGIVPVCCLNEEKQALLELFRSCFATTENIETEQEEASTPLSDSSAAILNSALAWCSSEFSQADWEVALAALHTGMDAAAWGAAGAAISVATVVTEEAEKVAGASLGGAEPSLAFFRQLQHKKILETSVKGAAAAQAIATSVVSSLDIFYRENGSRLLSLLQAYCTASKLIATTARTCPFTTWESSQAAVCAAILDIFISLGKIIALAGGCGQSASSNITRRIPSFGMKECWDQLSQVVDATVAAADRAFLSVVVERAGACRSEDGVGCTEALVALSLDLNTPDSARNAAYRSILLHSELVLDLVRSPAGDDDDALLETCTAAAAAAVRRDWFEELECGGLLPEIAAAASNLQHPCFTTAWGYIVAFLLCSHDSTIARTKLVERIKEAHGLVHAVLDDVLSLLPLAASNSIGGTPGGGGGDRGSRCSLGNNTSNSPTVAIFGPEDTSGHGFAHRLCAFGVPTTAVNITTSNTLSAHAALLYAGMLRALPALCRLWYGDLRDRSTVTALEKYTSAAVSAGLLSAEYTAVDEMVKGLDRFEKFSVRANSASREVVASMEVEDGHMIELVIRLPVSMPLKAPEAECKRSVGVSEARLRKWLLSITAFLRNRNGAIADALRLWKRNVDTEFEGHDDCLICYSIIQPSTGQLPRLACRCCRKKYHGTCLYKWFHSSGKSNCPHCQSPW